MVKQMVIDLGRFVGEFEHKVDAKGRIPIPPKFRAELKNGLVLTPGVEKYIIIHSLPEWEKVTAALTTSTITSSKLRRINRAIFATAFHLNIDSQGRIAIPAPLREYADIKGEVIIAGANTYIELWNKKQWETEKTLSQEQAWKIMESLGTTRVR